MTHILKPYGSYRETELSWMPTIPTHWGIDRPKSLFARMERPARDGDDVVTCFRDGVVTLRKNRRTTGFTESIKEIGYQGIRKGDLVIHAMDAFAGAIGVSDSDGKGTPVYSVCSPRTGVNAHYFALVLREMSRSEYLLSLAKGIRERSTDFRYSDFAVEQVPIPPTQEQADIVRLVNYLDNRVNRLIRSKRKLIELLNEQKQAITHDLVTGTGHQVGWGKSSGVLLVGDIPASWSVKRFRSLVSRIDQGASPQAEARLADDGWWGVLKAGCANGGVFRDTEHKRLPDEYVLERKHIVQAGDVIISRASGSPRLVGSAAMVSDLNFKLVLSDKTFRPVFREPDLAEFIVAAMNTPYYRLQVEQALSGAEGLANNLPVSRLLDFRIVIPPADIARDVVLKLQASVVLIKDVIRRTVSELELVSEYRTRLVSDVITGQLDVRNVDLPAIDEHLADALSDIDNGESDVDEAGDFEGDEE